MKYYYFSARAYALAFLLFDKHYIKSFTNGGVLMGTIPPWYCSYVWNHHDRPRDQLFPCATNFLEAVARPRLGFLLKVHPWWWHCYIINNVKSMVCLFLVTYKGRYVYFYRHGKETKFQSSYFITSTLNSTFIFPHNIDTHLYYILNEKRSDK